MNNKSKYIITAAFPYTNGYLHIGHLSGVFIPADIYVRFLNRYKNKKVLFLSGSDENGSSIIIESIKKKKKIKYLIDKYHKYIMYFLKIFDIKLNNYFRTSNINHHILSKKIFLKIFKKKYFFLKKEKIYYDKKYKQFLADRYVIGICPYCNEKKIYSDQCNKCGKLIKNNKLINPISILSNKRPIYKYTYNLFLNFSKLKSFIKKLIINYKKKKINKKIINTMINFIKKDYLINKSITRDLKWGVKLPINNNKLKNKKIYVWFEALIGYLSATIDYDKKNFTNWYKKEWFNENNKFIIFIGKDNIFYHSILLPIIYKKYKSNLILPYNINANEFLNLENKKISTSNNWALWLHDYLKILPKSQDLLRLTLIMDMPINNDSNFTLKKLKFYNNNILIGIIGNYFNRVIILIKKKYNNINKLKIKKIYINKKDKKILLKIIKLFNLIFFKINKFKFKDSLINYIKIFKIGNKYLSINEPWKINKKTKKFNNIIYITFNIINYIVYLSYYFLPRTYKKLKNIFIFKYKLIKKKKYNYLKFKYLKLNIKNYNKIFFKKINNYQIKKLKNIIYNKINK